MEENLLRKLRRQATRIGEDGEFILNDDGWIAFQTKDRSTDIDITVDGHYSIQDLEDIITFVKEMCPR